MTLAESIAYTRSRKGGQRPRDHRSFTEWRFGELCECLGFYDARGFAQFVERWGYPCELLTTYQMFVTYENSKGVAKPH